MRFRYYSLDQKGTLECERASEGGESNGSILRARCYGVVCRLFLALSMIPLASATDAQVRTPRDSPVIIHGRVQPSTSVDASRYLPTHIRPPDFIVKQVPSESIGITPGYRPLWVTGTYLWNGFESVWVPGHWVWEPRPPSLNAVIEFTIIVETIFNAVRLFPSALPPMRNKTESFREKAAGCA